MRSMSLQAGLLVVGTAFCFHGANTASAAPIYLNSTNMTVALGPTMPTTPPNGPFENVSIEQSLANVINLPTATSGELHTQASHVWVNNVPSLELVFDLQVEYDLTTLHFWNYFTEGFDVDNIAFTFFDSANVNVGSLSFAPALGGPGTSDSVPILAEHALLAFPSNVQFVNAVFTGTNGQVDFNNLGFTGELSPAETVIPEPGTVGLLTIGLAGLVRSRMAARRSRR
jgi:hypothetical protein